MVKNVPMKIDYGKKTVFVMLEHLIMVKTKNVNLVMIHVIHVSENQIIVSSVLET